MFRVEAGSRGGLKMRTGGGLADRHRPGHGPRGERRLQRGAAVREKTAQVGDADGALTRTCAGQRRALDEFQVAKAASVNRRQVGHGDVQARADDARDWRRRQRRRQRHIADSADDHPVPESKERVSRRETQTNRRRIARDAAFDAVGVPNDDRPEAMPIVRSRFEPYDGTTDRFRRDVVWWRADGDHMSEIDTGKGQESRAPPGDQTAEVAAGRDRLKLDRTSRHDHLEARSCLNHAVGCSRDDQRAGIEAHHVLAVGAVERDNVAAGGPCRSRGLPSGPALSDDDDIAMSMAADARRERSPALTRVGRGPPVRWM